LLLRRILIHGTLTFVQEIAAMGQVIAFPVPPTPYPDLAAELDTAECVLLSAIRCWVESYRDGDDPIPRLRQGLETAGSPDAALPIDRLMTVLARAVTRPVDIHCPQCPRLSLDEKNLLRAASLAQGDDSHLAEKVLRTTLLSAQGADFAISALEGLGKLFAQARLFLSRRRAPADDAAMADGREAWSPPHTLN
jgi:hypothetical protein